MSVEQSNQHNDLLLRLKALADPTRLAILDLLMEGVQCNCEIAERLDLSLSLVSHHMRSLREAGLVECEKDPLDARWVYYRVDPAALQDFRTQIDHLLDVERIQPRQPCCGPRQCERS
ncbi:MAG: ArsR/SmtB family transcription factor [Anaerolineae bacterium]